MPKASSGGKSLDTMNYAREKHWKGGIARHRTMVCGQLLEASPLLQKGTAGNKADSGLLSVFVPDKELSLSRVSIHRDTEGHQKKST